MLNGEIYYTRKGDYAIDAIGRLVICDDAARITWVEIRWPGIVHNNWVWSNSEINLSKDNYFDQKEYLIGHLAFSTSAAFKKGHNRNLREKQRYFNTKLAKIWIKSEHCIGLIKAQFQHLRGFGKEIQDKQDLDAILRLVMCAYILHNLLIDQPVLPARLVQQEHGGVGSR